MSQRSDELVKSSVDGIKKYDYFVVAIAAGIFTYVGKGFVAHTFGINAQSFEMLALMAFVVSVVSGLKKLELHNEFWGRNAKFLDLEDKCDSYVKAQAENKTIVADGSVKPPEYVSLKILAMKEVLPAQKEKLSSIDKKLKMYGCVRDWSLFVGFTLMALSKLLNVLISSTT